MSHGLYEMEEELRRIFEDLGKRFENTHPELAAKYRAESERMKKHEVRIGNKRGSNGAGHP